MNILERMWFDQRGGMFREFEVLSTVFEPKDPSLYRQLLPEPFGMPSQPLVMIFVVDYQRLYFCGAITRYQEWSVLLRDVWKGEESWFSVTMPVTTWSSTLGGRYLGFPKYVVDEITLAESGETRVATAKNKGIVQLTLEYHPGITRPLAPWEQAFTENEVFLAGESYQLVPPGRGPRVRKTVYRHVVPPKWSPKPGMVRVRLDPSEACAGLVPDGGEFVGSHNHFVGGLNLIPERAT